jgi:hypothetical protein
MHVIGSGLRKSIHVIDPYPPSSVLRRYAGSLCTYISPRACFYSCEMPQCIDRLSIRWRRASQLIEESIRASITAV